MVIKYRECILYRTDLEKLKIFKVIGKIYEKPELLEAK